MQKQILLTMCLAALTITGCATKGHDIRESATFPQNAEFQSVSAKRFLLKDEDGSTRASIAVEGGNVVRMKMGSPSHNEVFLLSVFPDGRAALLLKDDRGRNRLGLSIRDDGQPVVTMSDRASLILQDDRFRNRAVLNVSSNGTPALILYDDAMRSTRFDTRNEDK